MQALKPRMRITLDELIRKAARRATNARMVRSKYDPHVGARQRARLATRIEQGRSGLAVAPPAPSAQGDGDPGLS